MTTSSTNARVVESSPCRSQSFRCRCSFFSSWLLSLLSSPPSRPCRRRRLMLCAAVCCFCLATMNNSNNNVVHALLLLPPPPHHYGFVETSTARRKPLLYPRRLIPGNHHHHHCHQRANNGRIILASSSAAAAAAEVDELWQAALNDNTAGGASRNRESSYRSSLLFSSAREWYAFVDSLNNNTNNDEEEDLFWKQIKLEAVKILKEQPEAGPQLYQGIISQSSLLEAICTCISHQIETELIPATEVKNLFLSLLQNNPDCIHAIRCDLQAVPTRSPSINTAMEALLFSNGFHAMVCYRVGHLLWQVGRTGLAYYMQSTVSRKYSADIHPACRMGCGIYLRVGSGVVIGETATVGNDVSILEGVTLGGTGKEAGDRHPKVGHGVILQSSSAVLGNIPVGDGAVIMAKSIVTKPVPPLAQVSGVPARVVSIRDLDFDRLIQDDLQQHLAIKYLPKWLEIAKQQEVEKRVE